MDDQGYRSLWGISIPIRRDSVPLEVLSLPTTPVSPDKDLTDAYFSNGIKSSKSLILLFHSDSNQNSISTPTRKSSTSWWNSSMNLLRSFNTKSHSPLAFTQSNNIILSNLPHLSFDSTYDDSMVSRGKSILHLLPAVQKKVFIQHRYSLTRHFILLANGFCYYPDVDIGHTAIGVIKQARRVIKVYGSYRIDPTSPPVAIHLMLKTSISEALQFEDIDYQLSLRIQSDLNNQRDNSHVVKLFHLLETEKHLISVMELVNGKLEEYLEWIRTQHQEKSIFHQIVDAYRRLLAIGYIHCNLSMETVLLQLQANQENPMCPIIVVKLSGFEQAVLIGRNNSTIVSGECAKGDHSYMAPECFGEYYYPDKADIWSLGVILYCLLTGETPFDISNSSDPSFGAFSENGFASIESLLVESNADPDAIRLLKELLIEDPFGRLSFMDVLCDPYVKCYYV